MNFQESDPADQRIETPTADDLAGIAQQRDWVRGHFTPENTHLYEDFDQKLRLLDTILKNNWIEPGETWKLQSLGIALGDAFVQQAGFEWITVEDASGRDPALRLPGTTAILFPLTMISKRVERGESVDVYLLVDAVLGSIDELRERYTCSSQS
jgi:hypothetical protein